MLCSMRFLLTFFLSLTFALAGGGTSEAAASTLYVSPTGSGSACSVVAPCGSFQTAYNAASPGDTVSVAGGSYSGQSISGSKGLPQVEFRASSGTPTLSGLSISADNVLVDGLSVTDTLSVDAGCSLYLA